MKKHFINSWKKYLFSIIYILIILIIYMFTNGDWNLLISYVDGFFIGGFSLICISLLVLMNNLGAFDIFTYAFSKKQPGKSNLYDYSQQKEEKRKNTKLSFLPIAYVGLFFALLSTLLNLMV